MWFDEALRIAKRFENVYGDTSAVVDFVLQQRNLMRIRDEVGLDRLLFGTDFPVVAGSDIHSEIRAVSSCEFLSDEEKVMILRENAAKLLDV